MFRIAYSIVILVCVAAMAAGGTRISLALLDSAWQLGRVGLVVSLTLLSVGAVGLVATIRKGRGFVEKYKDKIVLLFFTLVISLVCAEILINYFRPAMPQFLQLDSELGWAPKPNVAGFVNERLGQPRFYARTDRLGLSGIAGEGDSIIFLIGDSMLNPHYDEEHSAPRVFLVSDDVRRRYRIVNGSATGYGTDQELLRMKNLLPQLQHVSHVVLFFLPLNDFANNVWHEVYMKGVGNVPKPFFELQADSLVYHAPASLSYDPYVRPGYERFGLFRLWDGIRNVLEGAISAETAPTDERSDTFDTYFKGQYAAEHSPAFNATQQLTARLLREVKTVCERHYVRLHVFVFDSPRYLSFVSHGVSMREKCSLQQNLERTVEETFRMAGLQFNWIVLEEDELIPGDIHPNKKGIAKVAKVAMAEVLGSQDNSALSAFRK